MALARHRRSDVALTSERSLDVMYGRFEDGSANVWKAHRNRCAADRRRQASDCHYGRAQGSPALAAIGSAEKGHELPKTDEVDTRYQTFVAKLKAFGPADPALVLGHTLTSCYLHEYESGGPRAFLQGLGRKTGLLYPHFQGRAKEKRVRPSVPVLDVLVRACVPAGEAVATRGLPGFAVEALWSHSRRSARRGLG